MSGVFRPYWRTLRNGHRHFNLGRLAGVFAIAWLVPGLIGAVLTGLLLGLSHLIAAAENALAPFGALGSLLLLSPLASFYVLPFALLTTGWAMRLGWGGSGVAALGGLVLPVAFGAAYQALEPTAAAVGAMAVLTPLVLVHAVILWLACRFLVPEAFALEKTPTEA